MEILTDLARSAKVAERAICFTLRNFYLFLGFVTMLNLATKTTKVGINCRFWTTSASGTQLFWQRIYNEDDNK